MRELAVKLCEHLSQGLDSLREKLRTDGENVVIGAGLTALHGLRDRPPAAPDPYARKLGDLNVREFSRLLGIDDVEAAKANHAKANEQMASAAADALLVMKDVLGLKENLKHAYTPIRLRSAKDAETVLMPIVSGFRDGLLPPGATAVLLLAWVEEGTGGEPTYRPISGRTN